VSLPNGPNTQKIITEYLPNRIPILCYTDPTRRPPLFKTQCWRSRSNQVPFFLFLSFIRFFLAYFFLSSVMKTIWPCPCVCISALRHDIVHASALSRTRTHKHMRRHTVLFCVSSEHALFIFASLSLSFSLFLTHSQFVSRSLSLFLSHPLSLASRLLPCLHTWVHARALSLCHSP